MITPSKVGKIDMSEDRPLKTVSDGRDPATGKFKPGNRAALGNSLCRKAARFRHKLFACVSLADFQEVIGRLVAEAKGGRPWAVKLLLQYLLGEPIPLDVVEEISQLQTEIERINNEFAK
jgi:hypothetical protein